MELRVLKYFLVVAREENITRAAALLHLTQPTLSRQLMQLEAELGVQLFRRSRYRIVLTDEGQLLRRRAQTILDLADKTVRDLRLEKEQLTGEVAVGCGESRSMAFLSRQMAAFRAQYPQVHFRIYSAAADDIQERLERGLLDLGLLMEPVGLGRYEFLRMPRKDRWALLVRADDPLAALPAVTPRDLAGVPLLMSSRDPVRGELASWFGDAWERIEVAATFNLILNAADMVRRGVGAALTFQLDGVAGDGLRFVPLTPELATGSVLAWKKNQLFSPAAARFLEVLRAARSAEEAPTA